MNNYPKKRQPAMFDNTFGKVPPQAREIEQAILGAILIERSALERTAEILTAECFYLESHISIYKAMQEMSIKSQAIDLLTLSEYLKAEGKLEEIGGNYYLTTLTNFVVSSANIEEHCHIIKQKYIQRRMIEICGQTINEAYEDLHDPFAMLDEFEKKYTELTTTRNTAVIPLQSLLVTEFKAVSDLKTQLESGEPVSGISSGYKCIDDVTHGWQPTDLIILAARPGVGKTAFALNLARNAATHKTRPVAVGFFSLEMSSGQLTRRLMAAESGVFMERLSTGKLEDFHMKQLFVKGVQPLSSTQMFIDDTPTMNIYQLRAKARSLKRKHDIGMIIIDYLQLMSGTGERRSGNREQEISEISRGLKSLAKELNIPVIALSQLSRDPERRTGESKMPRLSDLRESGAIEQDADAVVFMYRPEYYNQNSNEMGESNNGETIISIAKNRHGATADNNRALKLRADLGIQKFFEWNELNTPGPSIGWRPVESSDSKNLDY